MLKVFLDLDGVLVDFVSGMCQSHSRQNPYLFNAEIHGNALLENNWGMEPKEFWKPANESDWWANLNWMPDGHDILEMAVRRAGIENVCILTSGPTPSAASGKIRWIQKHIPEFSKQFLIGPTKWFCADTEAILIDDHDYNIDQFEKHGGYGVLVPRLWNRDFNLAAHSPLSAVEIADNRFFWAEHDIMCPRSDAC